MSSIPFVHSTFCDRLDAWFYFWETAPIGQLHLRLRVRWLRLDQVDDDRNELVSRGVCTHERRARHPGQAVLRSLCPALSAKLS
jgi:hypothetical protein